MERVIIALAGGFGGIAPSLIDKARGLQSGEIAKWLSDGNDIFVPIICSLAAMAVFFLIGAAVALIYRENVLSKAMVLGIGAPALIMAAAAAGGQGGKPVDVSQTSIGQWVSSAYAQDAKSPIKAFDLTVKSGPKSADCSTCSVQILGEDRKLLSVQQLDTSSGTAIVAVPEGANSIVFSGNNTNTVSVDVGSIVQQTPEASMAPVIDIERDRNYWNDVQRSLGDRSIEPYDFNVKIQK